MRSIVQTTFSSKPLHTTPRLSKGEQKKVVITFRGWVGDQYRSLRKYAPEYGWPAWTRATSRTTGNSEPGKTINYYLSPSRQNSVGRELWKSERCHIIQGDNNGETQVPLSQLLSAYLCQAYSERYQGKIQVPRKGHFEIQSFCKNARYNAVRVQ